MSSPSEILQAKTEDFNDKQYRAKYTVIVVGCSLTGIFHACLFADAGYSVICTDPDQTVTDQLAKAKIPSLTEEVETKLRNHIKTKHITAVSETKSAIMQGDIVILSLPFEVDSKGRPDYPRIEKQIRAVASCLRKGSLIIVTSIMGIGRTENMIREPLENVSGYKVGVDFGLVYSPIPTQQTLTLESVTDYGRIVASTDKKSLKLACAILAPLHKKELRTNDDVRTAETAVIFEVTKQNVEDALANEFAFFCEKAAVDYCAVRKLVNTDSSGVSLSQARADVMDKNVSSPLLEDAETLNAKLQLVAVAKQANEEIVKHITSLAKDALKSCGKSVRRARISVLGASQLPNMKSSLRTSTKLLVKTLEARGAKTRFYDPYVPESELREAEMRSARSLSDALEGVDCLVVVTAHDIFKRLNLRKLKVLMRLPAVIVDFEGAFDPEKVEEEGFVYRGVGRGVWSK